MYWKGCKIYVSQCTAYFISSNLERHRCFYHAVQPWKGVNYKYSTTSIHTLFKFVMEKVSVNKYNHQLLLQIQMQIRGCDIVCVNYAMYIHTHVQSKHLNDALYTVLGNVEWVCLSYSGSWLFNIQMLVLFILMRRVLYWVASSGGQILDVLEEKFGEVRCSQTSLSNTIKIFNQ